MSRTLISSVQPVGPYPAGAAVSAGALTIAWTAADTTNLNSFNFTGREILLVKNTDSVSHNLTLSSAPDDTGRTADISSYAVAAGLTAAFSFRQGTAGWLQSDGTVHFAGDNAMLLFAIITLPN